MLRLVILSVVQSLCLAFGQVFLKLAMTRMDKFAWSWDFFKNMLTNWWFLLVGITMGGGSILWMYILKHYPLSSAYPMTAMSYVFGMLASILILNETVPSTRWLGMAIIIVGVYFIVK